MNNKEFYISTGKKLLSLIGAILIIPIFLIGIAYPR